MNNQLEQIKAEIESLKNCSSPIVICDTLLSFIEFLQQEPLSSVETAESCEEEKKPVSNDLEDASIEICSKLLKDETIIIDGYEYVVLSDAEKCFKEGAKWKEKQMMKDAVDAEVVTPVYRGPDTKMTQLVTFGTSLKVSDRVKLIIIPETPEYTEGVTGHYTTTTK